MKTATRLAVLCAVGVVGGCSVISPQTGKPVPWYSCESAYRMSAHCLIEKQTGSVHSDTFMVTAIAPPPRAVVSVAGMETTYPPELHVNGVHWIFDKRPLAAPGAQFPAAFVRMPCGLPFVVACVSLVMGRIELKRGRTGEQLQADIDHELLHVAGGSHP